MRFVILTGMGRSGTTFVANLLDRARGVVARHQFFGGRTAMNDLSPRTTFRNLSYYQPGHPFVELTLRDQKEQIAAQFPKADTFVDVNSFLPYALDAVRATLDGVVCFQLVRNGRDVVSSQFSGGRYGPRQGGTPLLPGDPSTLKLWAGYSRFERLCWWWNDTVGRLLEQRVRTVHLERIVSDYRYLRENLLEPSGIDLDEDVWRALKDKRFHPGQFRLRRFRMSQFLRRRPLQLEWTPRHEESFMHICGETMRALGYE